jgi:hypothetical protein
VFEALTESYVLREIDVPLLFIECSIESRGGSIFGRLRSETSLSKNSLVVPFVRKLPVALLSGFTI